MKYVIKNIILSRVRLNNMIISSFDFDENIDIKNSDTSNIDLLYSDIVDSPEYKLLKRIAVDKYKAQQKFRSHLCVALVYAVSLVFTFINFLI